MEALVPGAEPPHPDRLHGRDDAAGQHAGEDRPQQERLRARGPEDDGGKQYRRVEAQNGELQAETDGERPLHRVGGFAAETFVWSHSGVVRLLGKGVVSKPASSNFGRWTPPDMSP